MNKLIQDYCEQICEYHRRDLCSNHRTYSRFWDLPAMAVICHNYSQKLTAEGFSHHPKGTKWHKVLKKELKRLGNIGTRSCIGKGYVIGNCAEQHAGNNYMKRFHENHLNNLYFTEAVRPRTMEIFPYCDNCKTVFPNL